MPVTVTASSCVARGADAAAAGAGACCACAGTSALISKIETADAIGVR
jgi:hypothetical protein